MPVVKQDLLGLDLALPIQLVDLPEIQHVERFQRSALDHRLYTEEQCRLNLGVEDRPLDCAAEILVVGHPPQQLQELALPFVFDPRLKVEVQVNTFEVF